jgi:hypothetical protein
MLEPSKQLASILPVFRLSRAAPVLAWTVSHLHKDRAWWMLSLNRYPKAIINTLPWSLVRDLSLILDDAGNASRVYVECSVMEKVMLGLCATIATFGAANPEEADTRMEVTKSVQGLTALIIGKHFGPADCVTLLQFPFSRISDRRAYPCRSGNTG